MYRSPASSSGAPGFLMLMVILGGAIHMAGCTDTPSDPELDNMPPVEDVEIEFATDTDLTASLIEDVSSSMVTNMTAAASVEIVTAKGLFSQANLALTSGDLDRVRSLGDQARDALGQALSRGRDRSSLNDFIDRARNVRRRLANGDTNEFDRHGRGIRGADRTGRSRTRRRPRRAGTDLRGGRSPRGAHGPTQARK